MKPTSDWGPALPENRRGPYADADLRKITTLGNKDTVIGIKQADGTYVIPMNDMTNGLTKRASSASLKLPEKNGVDNGGFYL